MDNHQAPVFQHPDLSNLERKILYEWTKEQARPFAIAKDLEIHMGLLVATTRVLELKYGVASLGDLRSLIAKVGMPTTCSDA